MCKPHFRKGIGSMSGFQFFHLATYSRKPNPAGQSIDQVVEEAERNPAFSLHVEAPEPPLIVYGVSVRAMKEQHDAMLDAARVSVLRPNGETAYRSIRSDRHTLLTAVASYPVAREQVEADPAEQIRYRAWVEANVAFLRERFGDQLRTVIEHTDETHPHLHAYVIPDRPDMNAALLHPGKAAKLQAEERAKAEGMTPRDAVKVGNDALKKAMRALQDEYHAEVGAPCGMTRLGPGRRRMSRKQWVEEKELAAKASVIAQKEAVTLIEERETAAEVAAQELAQEKAAISKQAEKLSADHKVMVSYAQKLTSRKEELAAKEAQLKQRESQVEAAVDGLAELVKAASDGDLVVEAGAARPGRNPGPDGRSRLERLFGAVLSVLPRDHVMGLLGRISGAIGAAGGRGKPPAPQASAEDREAAVWAQKSKDRLSRNKGWERDEPEF